jgi:hypothetical protein
MDLIDWRIDGEDTPEFEHIPLEQLTGEEDFKPQPPTPPKSRILREGENPRRPRPIIELEYDQQPTHREGGSIKEFFSDMDGYTIFVGLSIITVVGLVLTLVGILVHVIYQSIGIWGLLVPPSLFLLVIIGHLVGKKILE